MTGLFHISLLFAASALLLPGQEVSFSGKIYPVLEQAGCRNCHNGEGVASATRLHFPAEDAAKPRVEAFGKSLIEFVDRQNPGNSILLLKPTLRMPHTGGERREATPSMPHAGAQRGPAGEEEADG